MQENKSNLRFISSSEISPRDWQDFVDNHEYGTMFHTPRMYDVLKATPCHAPYAFFVIDDSQKIKAMIQGYVHTVKPGIWSFVSQRSVILQSPLYSAPSDLSFLLMGYLHAISRKVVYTEIRNHVIDSAATDIFRQSGFSYVSHLNYRVDCSDSEKAWSRISESKRRQIKKALKNGVTIIENPSIKQIESFYNILKFTYTTRAKKPLVSFEYFKDLYSIEEELYRTKFLLVAYKDLIIGGIVAPISKNQVIHEHYVAGLDTEYKDQYPSVIATWAAIDYATRNGIQAFDFMGAGSPDKDYGVREFKARFGGELLEPGRYMFIHSKLRYLLAKQGFTLINKLKGRK